MASMGTIETSPSSWLASVDDSGNIDVSMITTHRLFQVIRFQSGDIILSPMRMVRANNPVVTNNTYSAGGVLTDD